MVLKNGKIFNAYMDNHSRDDQIPTKENDVLRCDICEKDFLTIKYLKDHMKIHDQWIKYQCPACNKMFKILKMQEENNYEQKNTNHHDCSLCDQKFKHQSDLHYHYEYLHVQHEKCDFCDNIYPNLVTLNTHIEFVHKFLCHTCDKHLKNQIKSVENDPTQEIIVSKQGYGKNNSYYPELNGKSDVALFGEIREQSEEIKFFLKNKNKNTEILDFGLNKELTYKNIIELSGKSWGEWPSLPGTASPTSAAGCSTSTTPTFSSSSSRSNLPNAYNDDVMKLPEKDMHLFGQCPGYEDWYLVKCDICHISVKLEVFNSHVKLHQTELKNGHEIRNFA